MLKKLRKLSFFVILSIFVLMFSFASFTLAAEPWEGATITVLGGDHPGFNSILEIVPEFEEKYNIEVVVDQIDARSLHTRTMITGDAGDYDVVMADCQYIPIYAENNLIVSLEDFIYDDQIAQPDFDLEDIVPVYRELFTVSGTLYGMPMSGETVLYFYRKDLYKEHDMEPAKTLEELEEQIKYFDELDGVYGTSWRTDPAGGSSFSVVTLMWHNGGRFFENDDPNKDLLLNTPENVEAWEYYQEFNKYTPPGGGNYGYNEATQAFQQLQTAIYIDATNMNYLLDPSYSRLTIDNLGFELVPLGDGVEERNSVAAGWSLAIPKGSKNKEAAYKFIEFQITKENDKVLTDFGRMPNRISSFKDPDMIEKYPYLPKVWESLKFGNPEFRPRIQEWGEINNLLGKSANAVVVGEEDPQNALDELQGEIEEILNN